MTRSRRIPPPSAAMKPTKATPNRSRRLTTAALAPDAAKTATPTRSATSRLVTARGRSVLHRLVDLLALRAHGGPRLRRLRHRKLLAAQRHHIRTHDRALGDLLFAHVVEHFRRVVGVL